MRYFEIQDPYYALIKANDEEEAIKNYIEIVASDSDDSPLKDEIAEISQLSAFVTYGKCLSRQNPDISFDDIVEEFSNDFNGIMLVDSELL